MNAASRSIATVLKITLETEPEVVTAIIADLTVREIIMPMTEPTRYRAVAKHITHALELLRAFEKFQHTVREIKRDVRLGRRPKPPETGT